MTAGSYAVMNRLPLTCQRKLNVTPLVARRCVPGGVMSSNLRVCAVMWGICLTLLACDAPRRDSLAPGLTVSSSVRANSALAESFVIDNEDDIGEELAPTTFALTPLVTGGRAS